MTSQQLKKLKLPDNPGVYLFKKSKNTIYIGKATSLKDRVRSYFSKDLIQTRGPLLVDMVFQSDKIDFIKTDSVLEALILEAELIKKFQPKYNTKEKDDKSFNCVCITREKFPKVLVVRKKDLGNQKIKFSNIFGPFTNGSQLKEAMKIIRQIFPFLDDKSNSYYKFYKQVNLVPDISNKEGVRQYKNNIKNLILFFEGKKKKILVNLKRDMNLLAKAHKFEEAGHIRNQIFALNHINDVSLIKNSLEPITLHLKPNFRIEAYDMAHMAGKNMVGVMVVIENEEVNKGEYKKFKIRTQSGSNDTGALEEVLLRRFRHTEWGIPDLIVVDGSTAQINVAKKTLSFYKYKIPIVSVVKDDRHKARAIAGEENIIKEPKKAILLANTEAHRFAINYHKKTRSKNFIPITLRLQRTRK